MGVEYLTKISYGDLPVVISCACVALADAGIMMYDLVTSVSVVLHCPFQCLLLVCCFHLILMPRETWCRFQACCFKVLCFLGSSVEPLLVMQSLNKFPRRTSTPSGVHSQAQQSEEQLQ
ncbi:uncharacterized protein LOC133823509 [Humulus lupulus]|uniref:uncharacterized protein LOC133823509 n=1 Tax=Humulus lupulus TaxID=3486 RepID=UPI002B4170BB|nr:uncharacterized protein LOC133823509 [Humulus lupulus]